MEPHLCRDQIHAVGWPVCHWNPLAVIMDRDCRLMAMLNCPNNILRTPCSVTTDKHTFTCRHKGGSVYYWHIPLAKLNTDIALDPWECVVLANRQNDIICGQKNLVELIAH